MRLENALKEQSRRSKEEAEYKQKKIEEFEKEIEGLLHEYANENEQLKLQLKATSSSSDKSV